MDLTLTTPAVLFPAISLLLLAYTNRFHALASLLRDLYAKHQAGPSPKLRGQLDNLLRRIHLIRDMQLLGVVSFILCVLSMLSLFASAPLLAKALFAAALLFLTASLVYSVLELRISVVALRLQVQYLDAADPAGGAARG